MLVTARVVRMLSENHVAHNSGIATVEGEIQNFEFLCDRRWNLVEMTARDSIYDQSYASLFENTFENSRNVTRI